MKKIRQTIKYNLVTIAKKIKTYFGDDKLFFTCSPFKNGILNPVSTFGKDNIDKLETWVVMMQAKLFSENIDAVIMAVRIFLPDKVAIDVIIKGKVEKVEIPRRDLYYFGFTKDEITLVDENETYDCQNTDAFTGEKLEHEKGLIYRSSIELYDFLKSNDLEHLKKDDLKDEFLEPIVINLDDIIRRNLKGKKIKRKYLRKK